MALGQRKDFSRALVELLHCGDLLSGVDCRIVGLFVLSFEDGNFVQLVLNIVEATEGDDGAGWLAHHVDVEHKFSVLWVAATTLRDCHLITFNKLQSQLFPLDRSGFWGFEVIMK